MSDSEKLALVQELAEEAKKRVLFYYKNMPEFEDFAFEDVYSRVEEILSNITFGIDLEYSGASAYCRDEKTINACEPFFSLRPKELQIAILIHEINHAISFSNRYNEDVSKSYSNANYSSSFKMIEEGLADTQAELIMNYYYDNSGEKIQDKYTNFSSFFCGYVFDRSIIKTALSSLKINKDDKWMLLNYYFGRRVVFFEIFEEIFGDELLNFLKNEESSHNYALVTRYFEDIFYKEMEKKDFSRGAYNLPSFDNVYYKENSIIDELRISFFIQQLLKKYDIEKIDEKMIDSIYNATNCTIEQVTPLFVPKMIDKLIVSWINNCTIENYDKISKLIPDVYIINKYKYLYMMIEKILGKKIDFKNMTVEEKDFILDLLNRRLGYNLSAFSDEIYEEILKSDEYTDEEKESIGNDYSYSPDFRDFLLNLYILSSDEQRKLSKIFISFKITEEALKDTINKKIISDFGSDMDTLDVTKDVMIKLISDYKELINFYNQLNSIDILDPIICSWFENCDFKDLFLICDLIPNVFTIDDGKYFVEAKIYGKLSDDEYFNGYQEDTRKKHAL